MTNPDSGEFFIFGKNHGWGALEVRDMSTFLKHRFLERSLGVITKVEHKVLNTISNGVLKMQKGCISVRVTSIFGCYGIMIYYDIARFEYYNFGMYTMDLLRVRQRGRGAGFAFPP